MNPQDEEKVNQMVEEMKKAFGPEEIAFLMSMAYDPEMHEEGSQQQQPEKAVEK